MSDEGQSPQGLERLSLDCDLTIYNALDCKTRLIDAVRNHARLELDLAAVHEMDTAGFQLLVLAKRESQRLGHELYLSGHSDAVRQVIEFYDMVAFFGDPLVIPAGAAV